MNIKVYDEDNEEKFDLDSEGSIIITDDGIAIAGILDEDFVIQSLLNIIRNGYDLMKELNGEAGIVDKGTYLATLFSQMSDIFIKDNDKISDYTSKFKSNGQEYILDKEMYNLITLNDYLENFIDKSH